MLIHPWQRYYEYRPANLWSSKTVFFNPKSCILLTRIVFLKINTDCYADQCLLQFLYTGRIFFMDHLLNMHDFVTTVVFDEPWTSPNCQCEMLVGYFTGQNGHFAIKNAYFFFLNRILFRKIVLSYLLLKIVRNTTKSYWLAGLWIEYHWTENKLHFIMKSISKSYWLWLFNQELPKFSTLLFIHTFLHAL